LIYSREEKKHEDVVLLFIRWRKAGRIENSGGGDRPGKEENPKKMGNVMEGQGLGSLHKTVELIKV